jgi:hypothetical protein
LKLPQKNTKLTKEESSDVADSFFWFWTHFDDPFFCKLLRDKAKTGFRFFVVFSGMASALVAFLGRCTNPEGIEERTYSTENREEQKLNNIS